MIARPTIAGYAMCACLLTLTPMAPLVGRPESAQPAPAPRELEIAVDSTFAFSPAVLRCRAGEPVDLAIRHATPAGGPDLPHTVVILRADADVELFSKAVLEARPEDNYIPAGFRTQVMAGTGVLHPADRANLRFRAPTVPGRYPLVCSFPGHCLMGMRAVLIVE